MDSQREGSGLPWHIVEKAIYEEIIWLIGSIDIDSRGSNVKENSGIFNKDYIFYRSIAILIVNGKIGAAELQSKKIWLLDNNDNQGKEINHRHGKDWHSNTMNIVHRYFGKQNYQITTEPNLYKGRADLGIFKEGEKDTYIEVGTTSIEKLCINLHFMRDCIFLLVPIENKVIKLEIL